MYRPPKPTPAFTGMATIIVWNFTPAQLAEKNAGSGVASYRIYFSKSTTRLAALTISLSPDETDDTSKKYGTAIGYGCFAHLHMAGFSAALRPYV